MKKQVVTGLIVITVLFGIPLSTANATESDADSKLTQSLQRAGASSQTISLYRNFVSAAQAAADAQPKPAGPTQADVNLDQRFAKADTVGFLLSQGQGSAARLLTDTRSNRYLSSIHRGQTTDATTLPNMMRAASLMGNLNRMRRGDPHFRNGELRVGWLTLAAAIAQTDATTAEAHRGIYHHNHQFDQFSLGENLAWGMKDGGLAWCYGKERRLWEKHPSAHRFDAWTLSQRDPALYEQVGHYLNITDPRFHVGAMGFDGSWDSASEFAFGGSSITLSDYKNRLMNYARQNFGRSVNLDRLPGQVDAARGRIAEAKSRVAQWNKGNGGLIRQRTVAYRAFVSNVRALANQNGRNGDELLKSANEVFALYHLPQITKFSDVAPSDWFAPAVLSVDDKELMTGYQNGRFGPRDAVSRAQAATILWRSQGSPAAPDCAYADSRSVPQWAKQAVDWVTSEKIMTGYNDGRFGSNDTLSRSQAATVLARTNGKKGDLKAGMNWAIGHGLIKGWSNGNTDPSGRVDRGQMAQILVRADDQNLL